MHSYSLLSKHEYFQFKSQVLEVRSPPSLPVLLLTASLWGVHLGGGPHIGGEVTTTEGSEFS